MTEKSAAEVIHGLALRPLLGLQMADYCGRCRAGLWRDSWEKDKVRTLGLDLLGWSGCQRSLGPTGANPP